MWSYYLKGSTFNGVACNEAVVNVEPFSFAGITNEVNFAAAAKSGVYVNVGSKLVQIQALILINRWDSTSASKTKVLMT